MALCPLRRGRRAVRRGGVSAGNGLFGGVSREAGGRRIAGGRSFRRGGSSAAADAAAVCCVLRSGGLCAGAWIGDGRGCSGGQRYFLYRCGCADAAGGCYGSLRGAGGDLPRGCPTRPAGGTAADGDLPAGQDRPTDSSAGHGDQPCRSGERPAGAGGVPGDCGPAAAAAGAAPFDGTELVPAGGFAGAFASSGAGPAVLSAALPGSGGPGWFAAGGAVRLGSGRGKAVSGIDGGSVAHGTGDGVSCPLGRTGGKERSV